MSEHMRLEIANAVHRGVTLKPGDPVPGCGCERCTGHAAPPPRQPRTSDEWSRTVERARAVTIVTVLERLGCQPHRKGRRWIAICPLHDDKRPSLSVDADRGLWHCFPCGEGGDAIGLWMRATRSDFKATVQELGR